MRDPLPAPERQPSLSATPTLIAVGSDHGGDRLAWDVAAHLERHHGLPYWRCRSPIVELPALLDGGSEVVILDALWPADDASAVHPERVRELALAELRRGSGHVAGHGLGIADVLALLAAIDALPRTPRILGLPMGNPLAAPDPARVRDCATQVAALLARSPVVRPRDAETSDPPPH